MAAGHSTFQCETGKSHLCLFCPQVPLNRPQRRQERPLNMNHYANKKSAAESMLDVALLMANASQLKAVLEQGSEFNFYTPLIVLISISLILQISVGVLLIFIGTLENPTLVNGGGFVMDFFLLK